MPLMNQAIILRSQRRYHRCVVWVTVAVAVLSEVSASSALSSSSNAASSNNHRPPTLVSTGLVNLANTCYLNSQLQCAFHIPRVRSLILSPLMATPIIIKDDDTASKASTATTESDEASAECDDNDDGSSEPIVVEEKAEPPPEPVPETIGLQALRHEFQRMIELAAAAAEESNPVVFDMSVSPDVLIRALGINVQEQQDAQEFWKLLLPALQVPALTDLYQGAFQDYIVALDGSGRERRREEPFLDLSLDVRTSTTTVGETPSVMSSLQQLFGEPELLSNAEGNGWRPEKGADKVDAHKGSLLRPQGLPSILQLHLKRFNYDWNTDTMDKINDPVSFPKELDLSSIIRQKDDDSVNEDDDVSMVYDLQAIVVHMGVYGQGHYYSYVRPDVRTDDWYRFDDAKVTPVTYHEVVADATGGKPSFESSSGGGGGLFGFIRRILSGGTRTSAFGYGGRTSNAYVIQYVRRRDIPMLYDIDKQ